MNKLRNNINFYLINFVMKILKVSLVSHYKILFKYVSTLNK